MDELIGILDEIDVVAIDEAQFFADIAEKVELFCNMGKIVLVAALDGTFERKPFGKILELIPLAEQVQKLSAVCFSCGKDANYTKRLSDCKDIELIGGEEMYKPVCRGCFFKNDSAKKQKSIEDLKILEDSVENSCLSVWEEILICVFAWVCR